MKVTPDSRLYVSGTAITIVAVLLLTFALNLLVIGSVRHARDQTIAYSTLRADLANGTAPVNQYTCADDPAGAESVTPDAGATAPSGECTSWKPLDLGTPLGIIEVPWLNLREVFFEGTTSGVLQSGPGHRRDSPMPGQSGNSVIFGRQSAYDGPFGGLELLGVGSQFTIISGQGESRWRVIAVRRGGDPQPPALAVGAARVTLVTATGPPFAPNGALRIDADLITGVDEAGNQIGPWPAGARAITAAHLAPSERVLAGDVAAWPGIVLFSLLLLPVAVAVGWARYAWGTWQAWVSGLPILLALGLALTDRLIQLLPNVL